MERNDTVGTLNVKLSHEHTTAMSHSPLNDIIHRHILNSKEVLWDAIIDTPRLDLTDLKSDSICPVDAFLV